MREVVEQREMIANAEENYKGNFRFWVGDLECYMLECNLEGGSLVYGVWEGFCCRGFRLLWGIMALVVTW